MRICYDCGYRGPERTCPQDGLPTFDEGGTGTVVAQAVLAGRVFADRYEVVRQLGAGGMGAVYLARHRAMHQDVALKVMHKAASTNPDAIKRFFREARLSAQLNHPSPFVRPRPATPSRRRVHFPDGVVDFPRFHVSVHRAISADA